MQHQLHVSQLLPKRYSIIQDHEGLQSAGPYSDTILLIMMYVLGAFNKLLIFPCAKINFAVLWRQLLLLRCSANDLNRTSQAVADRWGSHE
jgi:hypothetical protein